ncbi:hypothetical protein IT408_03510 [Candidatus Uhrbacteria bacterium]|nr:hypothetical protein [Candidatus Uhrbacteria bacterium]
MRRFYFAFLIGIGCIIFYATLQGVFAATSTNFETNQERAGTTEFDASSTNFLFKAEISDPGDGVSISSSTNYVFDHGSMWFSSTGVSLSVRWAVPELRVGASSTNDDAGFFLALRPVGSPTVIASSGMATTSNDGTYATSTNVNALAGTYDVTIKTHQHLSKKISAVNIISGTTTELNFTNGTNLIGIYGTGTLLAGDINGGFTTSTLGDNVVNSVDLSIIIPQLDADDPSGNGIRSNLNQDIVVNSVDLSMMLKNLDLVGE